jgi:phosphonoacetaldehyde dehydrogenase
MRVEGKYCTEVKRVLVIDTVADAFLEKVVARTKALTCGDPMDPNTGVGTVMDEPAAVLFENRVDDDIASGAILRCRHVRNGGLYPPTVVDHVPADFGLVCARKPSGRSVRSFVAATLTI